MFTMFQSTTRISPQEARTLVQQKQALLLDVRTPQEYREGHVAGSVNLELDQIPAQMAKRYPNQDMHVIVICHSGARSRSAYFMLKKMGYHHLSDLGGILSWPYDITR